MGTPTPGSFRNRCFSASASLRFNGPAGALLVAVFSLVWFALALHANITKNQQITAFVFVAVAVLPLVLLTRAGRQRIGLVWPTR